MLCDWQITADADKSVEIKFVDFELEYDENCESDYLEIIEEPGYYRKSYGRFCGVDVSFLLAYIFERKKLL